MTTLPDFTYEEMLKRTVKSFSTYAVFSLHPADGCEPITYGDLPSFLMAFPPRRLIPEIAASVLIRYPDVSMKQVLGKDRHANICMARHHVWHQIKQERFDISISEIARRFNTDHGTIIHGIKRHEERLQRAGKGLRP